MENNKLKENIELPINDVLSYSRIDVFKQCPYRYKLKYIDKNYTNTTSLALQIGTLAHYCMEMKYSGMPINDILTGLEVGFKNNNEVIKGLNELIEEYPFEFYEVNEKSGMSVEDKIKVLNNKLKNEITDEDWEVIGLEKEFEIVFNNKARIKGFIDRIDKNKKTGEIRVIDYKTNNKEYDKKDLATPLQMYIYSLACYEMYGIYPSECIYDMLFLDVKQKGGTKGFLDRGFKALNKILDSMIYYQELGSNYLQPKPSPLCAWCPFSVTNPNSDPWYNNLCEYYSLWTRENKTFKVNKTWQSPTLENKDDEIEGWD